ncbi:MAG: acyl-CoA synthetase [Pseudomonadales bacterium]|nr:acyl-CoA synthetase [Pseudomonadales bacterium]
MYPGMHPGDKVAYQMAASGETVTYAELEYRSNQVAHGFRSLGLQPGDGIALLLENNVRYLQICWGAQRSGLYFTPISIFFQAAEVSYILGNSDASVLITTSAHAAALSQIPAAMKVFVIDEQPDITSPAWNSWDAFIAEFPGTPIADQCEGAEMIYSSGTTGQPKGVRFPLQRSPLGTVSQLYRTRVAMHQVNEQTRYLSTAPMYHSAPLRYNLMVTRQGGTAVIMEKFEAEQALQLIEAHQITHSQWVPTMFVRLLKLPAAVRQQYDVSSLKYAIHAAAPCPIAIKQAMIDWWGPVLYEYYSGTEANGSTAINSQEWLTHKGSVGRAIHGELRILDDEGRELPAGKSGGVYFANGSDFSYYKDPEKTAAARSVQGWTTLGDIGYVDEEGYLYLQDRKSFMIISGGVNIYPQEVENLLVTHPAVMDVAVIGVPNEEFGEEVKAVVQLTAGHEASAGLADALIAFCREHISHVKCPRSVDFVAELPRHPTGKLYKRKLREQYWAGHQTAII